MSLRIFIYEAVNGLPKVTWKGSVGSRSQIQVNISIYHLKPLGQEVLLWGIFVVVVVVVLMVFSNHKGLTPHLLPCLLPQVLQLENVMVGLFCQKLSQDPESGRFLWGVCWPARGVTSASVGRTYSYMVVWLWRWEGSSTQENKYSYYINQKCIVFGESAVACPHNEEVRVIGYL